MCWIRPYHVEYTGSRPISEVKQRRAWLVLRWVTTWESRVLCPFFGRDARITVYDPATGSVTEPGRKPELLLVGVWLVLRWVTAVREAGVAGRWNAALRVVDRCQRMPD